jgi:hypothetical protein
VIGDFANRQQSGPEQLGTESGRARPAARKGWTVPSTLAVMTSRIRLATLATSVAWRNRAHLAKIVACVSAKYQQ